TTFSFLLVCIVPAPTPSLFPYTTLFRSSPTVAFLDIGILVFREGLECILVLAAITASMTGAKRVHRQPVALGAGVAFVASLITRSEEHTSELQSRFDLVCRLLLEKKK